MTTASSRDLAPRGNGQGRSMTGPVGGFVVRRARLVLVAALLAVVGFGVLGVGAFGKLQTGGFEDPGAGSTTAQTLTDQRFVLTTHYMDEAEYLADRIAVLSAGRIVAEGTPATLGGRDHMTTAISFTLPDHVQARDLPPGLSSLTVPGPGGSTVVHSQSPLAHLQMLGDWALG